jgi:hypothetical protein
VEVEQHKCLLKGQHKDTNKTIKVKTTQKNIKNMARKKIIMFVVVVTAAAAAV